MSVCRVFSCVVERGCSQARVILHARVLPSHPVSVYIGHDSKNKRWLEFFKESFTNVCKYTLDENDGIEGCVLIFSCENSKITTRCWTTITGECWIPPNKDTPHPRAKKKPQQDGRRGEITFGINTCTRQRRLEGSRKPCAHQDPETPQRLSQNYIWVSPVEVQVSSGLPQEQGLWVQ